MKTFLIALAFLMACATCAEASDELDAAELRLVCAVCAMGAYSDDESYLMRSMLTARGWQIEKLSRKNNLADAKAYLVSRGDVTILTIAGTESLKDVEVDFRVGRVHLNDNTVLAPNDKNSGDKLFVHRGFRDYADVVLGDGLAERLMTALDDNSNATLYLTGHSLGGSVAIIAAIRLTDLGVPNDRLKVVTFGAPAVGSHALAQAYEDKIDLTRVEMHGDVLKKSLRALGYVQFGNVIEYRQSVTSDHFEHKMAVYLDCAIRDFCAAGGSFKYDAEDKIAASIYIAPLLVVEDSLHKSDAAILPDALNDSLTNHYNNFIMAGERVIELKEKRVQDEDFDEFIDAAENLDCDYVLIRVLRAKKIRDAPLGDRLVTLEEIIFDRNGVPLSMQTAGASTENLTIVEAALAAQETLNERLKNFFASR